MDCGSCTLCCKLSEICDLPVPSPVDSYCMYCDSGVGCKNYITRPEECKQYQCMWSQMENAGIELRPDECRIIFERTSRDVINARLEKGRKLNSFVVGQIRSFNREGFSVFILRGRSNICYLAANHTTDYVRKVVHDRAKLHRRLN